MSRVKIFWLSNVDEVAQARQNGMPGWCLQLSTVNVVRPACARATDQFARGEDPLKKRGSPSLYHHRTGVI